MKSKKKWLNLWENAPTKNFINYPALDVDELKSKGVTVTDDWARALYLLQKYSGGGYLSAAIKMTSFWRALKCRCNVPYAEEIGNLFYEELLLTYPHNRDVPTLLKKISRIIGHGDLDDGGELKMILDVIKEKTGCEFKRNIENIPSQKIQGINLEYDGSPPGVENRLRHAF